MDAIGNNLGSIAGSVIALALLQVGYLKLNLLLCKRGDRHMTYLECMPSMMYLD